MYDIIYTINYISIRLIEYSYVTVVYSILYIYIITTRNVIRYTYMLIVYYTTREFLNK